MRRDGDVLATARLPAPVPQRASSGPALLAAVAMVMTVAIPWLTGRAIDQIQRRRQGRPDARSALADRSPPASLRLGLTVARRLVAGRVSLGVEHDLRNRIYGHLQSLELGFFDRQQTGQLMSRATVDLQSVRFFLGYGLVFIAAVGADDPARRGGDVRRRARAGGDRRSSPVPFVVVVAARYGRRSRPGAAGGPAADRRADRRRRGEHLRRARGQGVRARGAPARALPRAASARVFDQAMVSTRLQAFYNPFIGFLPQLGLAAILLRRRPPGDQRHADARRLHRLLRLPADADRRRCARSASRSGMAQRATASGARLFEILDREPRIVAPPGAPAAAGGRRPRRAARRDAAATRAPRAPALRDVDLDVAAGTTVALVGATGSGKTTLVQLLPRLYDVTAGAVLVDGADVRDVDLALAARARSRVVDDDPFLFSATRAPRTSPTRAPDATPRGDRARRRGARRPHELHRRAARRLRHARRRARADAVAAASASGSRSRARCSPTRAS